MDVDWDSTSQSEAILQRQFSRTVPYNRLVSICFRVLRLALLVPFWARRSSSLRHDYNLIHLSFLLERNTVIAMPLMVSAKYIVVRGFEVSGEESALL